MGLTCCVSWRAPIVFHVAELVSVWRKNEPVPLSAAFISPYVLHVYMAPVTNLTISLLLSEAVREQRKLITRMLFNALQYNTSAMKVCLQQTWSHDVVPRSLEIMEKVEVYEVEELLQPNGGVHPEKEEKQSSGRQCWKSQEAQVITSPVGLSHTAVKIIIALRRALEGLSLQKSKLSLSSSRTDCTRGICVS